MKNTCMSSDYIPQGRSHWSGWSGFYPTTFLASSYVYIFITSESDRSGVTVRIGESYRLCDIGRRARGGVDTAPSVGTGTHLLRKCDTLRRWLPPTAPSYRVGRIRLSRNQVFQALCRLHGWNRIRNDLRRSKISNFSWGACPQTPLAGALRAHNTYTRCHCPTRPL